jgi:hypothetical protein
MDTESQHALHGQFEEGKVSFNPFYMKVRPIMLLQLFWKVVFIHCIIISFLSSVLTNACPWKYSLSLLLLSEMASLCICEH